MSGQSVRWHGATVQGTAAMLATLEKTPTEVVCPGCHVTRVPGAGCWC